MITIRQLRYFVSVLECGSFSKAAAQVHVAQPALSLHVRQMENELGVKLLERSPRGVSATSAGLRLGALARTILGDIAAIPQTVGRMRGKTSCEMDLNVRNRLSPSVAVSPGK